jgi:hypothetical protein
MNRRRETSADINYFLVVTNLLAGMRWPRVTESPTSSLRRQINAAVPECVNGHVRRVE